MNILYSAFIREDSEAKGYLKKVISQCFTFKKEFDNVYLYLSRKSEAVLYKVEENTTNEIDVFSYSHFAIFDSSSRLRKIKSFFRYNSFLTFLSQIIDLYEIDVLYYRNAHPANKLFNLAKKKDLIKIIEFPTYPYIEEYKKIFSTLEYNLFWKTGAKKIEDFADIIVGIVGDNLLNVDKKFILISNGIRLENIKPKNQLEKSFINLVSIANVAFWHGYDRVIKGMYEYYKKNSKKEVYYHCVGEGPELENLKNLVKELKLEKYVIFHGTKTGEELDEIVDTCDIAIGSLGMHRTGLEYGSTLKLREYCARGIPFVYGYNDPDFNNFEYSLKIENDETPVNIEKVIEFYDSIKNENYIEEMRKYAEENLTWDIKMKPVIDKMKELANEKKGV